MVKDRSAPLSPRAFTSCAYLLLPQSNAYYWTGPLLLAAGVTTIDAALVSFCKCYETRSPKTDKASIPADIFSWARSSVLIPEFPPFNALRGLRNYPKHSWSTLVRAHDAVHSAIAAITCVVQVQLSNDEQKLVVSSRRYPHSTIPGEHSTATSPIALFIIPAQT